MAGAILSFKAINPKNFDDAAVRAVIEAAAEEVSKDVLLDFELTTATWQHRVKFEREVSIGPNSIDILVGTDDKIYAYVNEGTKPHMIWAGIYTGRSDKKALSFPGTFSPKTIPGLLTARKGFSGGDQVVVPYVSHPGTEPRKFDKLIQKMWKKKFSKRMQQAMRDARNASGHAI